VATTLIGRLGAVALASHQVALNTVSLTYMVPLGISSAAAVRVGQALGRRERARSQPRGMDCYGAGHGLHDLHGSDLAGGSQPIVRAYTPDPMVIQAASSLLLSRHSFSFSTQCKRRDGRVARRGRYPDADALPHFFFYWAIGLPLGYHRLFSARMGRRRIVDGLVPGADPDWDRAALFLAPQGALVLVCRNHH